MPEWIKPFVRQDPLRFTQFNGDKSVNFGFETLVLNNPGYYHTALRKNQITFHKVQIYSCSDCFRRWLAFLAGCKEGARLMHLYMTLLKDVLLKGGVPPSFAYRAVRSHGALEGTCGVRGRAGGTRRAARVGGTRASKPSAARAQCAVTSGLALPSGTEVVSALVSQLLGLEGTSCNLLQPSSPRDFSWASRVCFLKKKN